MNIIESAQIGEDCVMVKPYRVKLENLIPNVCGNLGFTLVTARALSVIKQINRINQPKGI